MIMTDTRHLTELICEDWSGSSHVEICIQILNYVVEYPASKLKHISYGSLKKLVGPKFTDEQLLVSIQYLCGERVPVLEPNFEFIENDELYIIPNSEIEEARRKGVLIHPLTGEEIYDFENCVFMFFVPSSLAIKVGECL